MKRVAATLWGKLPEGWCTHQRGRAGGHLLVSKCQYEDSWGKRAAPLKGHEAGERPRRLSGVERKATKVTPFHSLAGGSVLGDKVSFP